MHTPFFLPLYAAVVLCKNNKILLIQRKNSDWAPGLWNFPGGLVEKNETIAHAAQREIQEEVGIEVQANDLQLVHMLHVKKNNTNTQDIVGVYFCATEWDGEPHNNEPEKIGALEWFALDDIPHNSTEHAMLIVDGLQSGNRYSEHGW